MKGTSKHRLMQEVEWERMSTRRKIHKLILYFKIVNNLSPIYLKNYFLYKFVKEQTIL